MSEQVATKESASPDIKALAIVTTATVVCALSAGGLGLMLHKRAAHDAETSIAYPQIARTLAEKDLIATQLIVNVDENTFGFLGYNDDNPYRCEGSYVYADGTITVKLGELSCVDVSPTNVDRNA